MGKCVSKNVEAEEIKKKGKSPSKSPVPKESPVKEAEEAKENDVKEEKPVENGTLEAHEPEKTEPEKTELVKDDKELDEGKPEVDEENKDADVKVETIETEDGMIITRKSVSVKTTTVTKIVGGQIETSETTVDKKLIGCTEEDLPEFIKERLAAAEERTADIEIKEQDPQKDPVEVFKKDCEIDAVEFIRIWKHYDKDQSGYLQGRELYNFLKDLMTMRDEKVTDATVEAYRDALLKDFDVNNDGNIAMREMSRILPVEKNFLTKFNTVMANTNLQITTEEVDEIFSHYDKNGDKTLSGDELLAFLNDILEKQNQVLSAPELTEYADLVKELYDVGPSGKLKREHVQQILAS